MIATHGLERVTLRDVATTLGVTTGVLTHYFPSKKALLRHTKDRAFDRSFRRAVEAAGKGRGLEGLHEVVAEMLPLDRERRILWQLLVAFYGSAVGVPALRRSQARRMQRWFALFRDVVAELTAAGDIAAALDPERVGMAIALFVEGMAIQLVMTAPETAAAWQLAFAREQVERLVLTVGGARSQRRSRRRRSVQTVVGPRTRA